MLLRSLDAMVARFSALFEPTLPVQRARWEFPLLFVLVLAGAVLRFWGLGNVGLHGDEDLMALPTRHLLEHGSPLLPSGMFYPRAIVQVYLMAASGALFGFSEWALRLPSVLCGIALIALSYLLGKRFLSPPWSMALAAMVAFLPGTIADSQEARMYGFLLACLAAYAILLFRWERTNRLVDLAAAVVFMLIAIQFHELAVFAAFLTLFPGLARGDAKKLLNGAGAFVAIGLGFALISAWIDAAYPDRPFSTGGPNEYVSEVPSLEPTPGALDLLPQFWQIAVVLLLAGALAIFVARKANRSTAFVASGVLLFLGLLAQAALHYHVAVVLLIVGATVVQRNGAAAWPRLTVLFGVSVIIAAAHITMLHLAGVEPFRRVIGGLVGRPSIWPLLQLGEYSRAAWVFAWAGLGWALYTLLSGRRIADHWLFFLLGVWVPLGGVGLFMWYVPERYTEFALLPLLIAALASLQQFMVWVRRHTRGPWIAIALGALACGAIINPWALARSLNPGYDIHPDHKGAAQYMRSVDLSPRDIVIAEDATEQTYYLGKVDYSLVARYVAADFVKRVDGRILNIYTGVPMITTGEELLALLRQPDRGALYVIGSGENQEDGRSYMRGLGIAEALSLPQWQVVYQGRDGLTKVWKAPAPVSSD